MSRNHEVLPLISDTKLLRRVGNGGYQLLNDKERLEVHTSGGFPDLPVRRSTTRMVKFWTTVRSALLQALIARNIIQIKGLDIPTEKGYPSFNSHTIQSSGKLSA